VGNTFDACDGNPEKIMREVWMDDFYEEMR